MFFTLSKILSSIVYPVPVTILALIAVFIFYRRRYTRRILLVVIAVFYVLSMPMTANLLLARVEMPPTIAENLRPTYDTAIVLTGMMYLRLSGPARAEYSDGVDRILAGIQLVRNGRADRLLISGGSGDLFDQSLREADFLQDLAIDFGVDPEKIIIERDSRNTYENARFSSRILDANNFANTSLVTSASHMRRALACFRRQGIHPDAYTVDFRADTKPTLLYFLPSSEGLINTRIAVREIIGLIVYRINGYI